MLPPSSPRLLLQWAAAAATFILSNSIANNQSAENWHCEIKSTSSILGARQFVDRRDFFHFRVTKLAYSEGPNRQFQ